MKRLFGTNMYKNFNSDIKTYCVELLLEYNEINFPLIITENIIYIVYVKHEVNFVYNKVCVFLIHLRASFHNRLNTSGCRARALLQLGI